MIRQTKRRTAGRKNFENGKVFQSSKLSYEHRVSFYDIPPLDELTLEEFEKWAIDRLKILIEIESCTARSKTIKETELIIKPLLNKYLPLSPATKGNEQIINQERKKDHYSHFILRLVFCRSEELRKKFIRNETILFKIRYGLLQPKEQTSFIKDNNDKLNWIYIDSAERDGLFEFLYNSTVHAIKSQLYDDNGAVTNDQLKVLIKQESFIKLPFENIPHLLSSRSIYVTKGFGYVPTTLQLNLLVNEYQKSLEKALIKTFQSIPRLDEDDRLLPVLNNLSKDFANVQYEADFGGDVGDINSSSILTPSINKHYPLCATHLQKSLLSSHHLRYQGRQQLSLFLKGIGLNIDEAMKFWSFQFTQGGMSLEKFDKEYKYNIRHTYGLEGARINYKPWDCGTILSKPKPTKQEAHGCPYRDLSTEALVVNLNDMGINDRSDINGILDDVNKNSYTVACTRVFELTHKNKLKGNENLHINHPNLYFDRSRQFDKT